MVSKVYFAILPKISISPEVVSNERAGRVLSENGGQKFFGPS